MERNEFRVAAALLGVVVLAIGAIFYVRVSGAESLRDAFSDPYGAGPWDADEFERCYELYERLGLWGYGEGVRYTQDTHTETMPDGTNRTSTLSVAFFDDEAEAGQSLISQEAAMGQLRNSDCFEAMEDLSQSDSIEPSVAAADGLAWATLVGYPYDEGSETTRREIYVWLDGPRTATLDVWVDDTGEGAAFVRARYRQAVAQVAAAR
ncbi:MAG: hypothetical protein WD557_09585 [Dehalococcoidia bacterium]